MYVESGQGIGKWYLLSFFKEIPAFAWYNKGNLLEVCKYKHPPEISNGDSVINSKKHGNEKGQHSYLSVHIIKIILYTTIVILPTPN